MHKTFLALGIAVALLASVPATAAVPPPPPPTNFSFSSLLYQMPRAEERVKDSLRLQVASSSYIYGGTGQAHPTLRDLFAFVLGKDYERYEVVEARWVLTPDSLGASIITFVFTERTNIRPLIQLAPS